MADQPNNVKEYADLESLIFQNKMLENQQRFNTADKLRFTELEKRKASNLGKMKTIISTLEDRHAQAVGTVPILP